MYRNSKLSLPQPEQVGPFKQADPSFPPSDTSGGGGGLLKGFGNPSFNRGIWSGQVPPLIRFSNQRVHPTPDFLCSLEAAPSQCTIIVSIGQTGEKQLGDMMKGRWKG